MSKGVIATFLLLVIVLGAVVGYFIVVSSEHSNSLAVYQVISENLRLQGQAAVVPCVGLNEADCPSASNASLFPVELVKFGGSYYYLFNFTETAQGTSVFSNSSTTITYPSPTYKFTTWFTNSTVYCISPAHPLTNTFRQHPTCPTTPYKPASINIPTHSISRVDITLGIRLDLSLSTNSSGALYVTVSELNLRNAINNLTARGNWPNGTSSFFLWTQATCGSDLPIGYEVLKGDYGMSDFTTATPLTIAAQPWIGCPYFPPIRHYAFWPLSNVAVVPLYGKLYNVSVSTSRNGIDAVSGYWTGSTMQNGAGQVVGGACPDLKSTSPFPGQNINCPLVFNLLSPGTYTVVAADEWGQVVLLHLEVQV